jgi:vesicle transport through interaction with t-SNAREs protein 1
MSGFDQSLFDTYEVELKTLIDGIRTSLVQVDEADKDSKASILQKIGTSMGEANEIIKQMNIEVRTLPSAEKKTGSEKVAEFQNIMTKIKFDYDRSKEKSNRSALIGDKSAQDRDRMITVNEKLARQNDAIANACRVVSETEEVGMHIVGELRNNREKIESAQAKVQDFDGYTASAAKTVRSMENRDKCCIM